MSDQDLVLLERQENGVAVVTLNSPKVNALSTQLLGRLLEVAQELTSHPAGAVVVTCGDRLFAAGADISQFGGADDARRIGGAFHAALNAVASVNFKIEETVVAYKSTLVPLFAAVIP